MIRSFACRDTQRLARGQRVARFAGIDQSARKRLRHLELAERLADLAVVPGNRLEALRGNRAGQHSIRINDQYRLCFRWINGNAVDVEIVDYH